MKTSAIPDDSVLSAAALVQADAWFYAHRTTLELCHGPWSNHAELCEDGRATRLACLPDGGALHLTRGGDLLIVHVTRFANLFRARIIRGPAPECWTELEALCPGLGPGSGIVPRYWVLREMISPWVVGFALYDLRCFETCGRGTFEEVARTAATLNQRILGKSISE